MVTDLEAPEAPAKPRGKGEWNFQQLAWVFLQKALPYGAWVQSIDESAKRSEIARIRRKASGHLGGEGDIYVFWEATTLWLELKDQSDQRTSQKAFQEGIERNRGFYAKVKTLEDIEAACIAAGIPLRATLGAIQERIADQRARVPVKRKRAAHRPGAPINSMSLAQYRRLNAKEYL